MSAKKVTAIIAAALCVTTIAGFAVKATADAKTTTKTEEKLPDILINTTPVKMQDINSKVDFVATLKASESVSVYPKLSGKVAKTYFEIGDKVNAGDVLFELDTTDYQTGLDSAKAAQTLALASYNRTTGSGLEQSLLSLEMQKAMAAINSDTSGDKIDDLLDEQKDLRKKYAEAKSSLEAVSGTNSAQIESLTSQVGVAKADMQAKVTAYSNLKSDSGSTPASIAAAEAEVNAATAKYENLKGQLDTASAPLTAAQTAYNSLSSQLSANSLAINTAYKVDDPLDAQQYYYYQQYDLAAGKAASESEAVAKAQLEQTMLGVVNAEKQISDCKIKSPISGTVQQKNVKTFEMAAGSMATYVITVNNSLNVEFAVSDRYIKNIVVNDTIKVDTAAGIKDAVITEVSETADVKTGLYVVKALIDNSNNQLRVGSTVKVTVTTQKSGQAVTVPVKSVRYQNEEAFVYKYVDGKAARIVVTTGISDDTSIEIKSGISNDDVIITTWHPNLRDGVAVVQAQQ